MGPAREPDRGQHLIVTCQNCDTSFQLDDSRVPPQGIRVRCSRCKEAFFLENPSMSKSEAVHAVAEQAARAPAKTPAATRDLPAAGRSSGSGADEEEHDWEFNVDPSKAKVQEDDGAGGSAFGGDAGDGSSGLSLEGEEDPVAADEDDGSSAFGSVDDFSSLMEEDDDIGSADAGEAGLGLDSPGIDMSAAERPEAGVYAATRSTPEAAPGPAGEELGEPESWDFFGDDADGAGSAPADASAGGAVVGRIQLTAGGADRAGALAEAWEDDADDWEAESGPPSLLTRGLGLMGRGAGWALTIGMVALGLVSGLHGAAEQLVRTPQALELGPLRAVDVRGVWLDTSRGETLLSVVGELHTNAGRPQTVGGIVEVSLLDRDGRPLALDPQPAATPVAPRVLREGEPEVRRVELDRAAWALAHRPIQPGQGAAFQAVFQDVPAEAARIAIRIHEQPGAAQGARAGGSAPMAVTPVLGEGATAETTPATPADGGPSGQGEADAGVQPPAPPPLPEELTWGD